MPNLQRLQYRVYRWDRAFEIYINQLKQQTGKPVIICGDMNIVRHDRDIHNTNRQGRPGTTKLERDSFEQFLTNCELNDTFRQLHPLKMMVYSHWTDRCGIARKRNWGSRMDYFLTSSDMAEGGMLGKYRLHDVKYMS